MSPVHPTLAQALSERGYAELTPVQSAVLASETAGRDLLVSAHTGSGKTVAYGLALAPDLLGEAATFGPAGEALALVVAPTRELALQVQRELAWLYAGAGARVVACVGGMDPRAERRELAIGAHIVVGTPGRLRDHIERDQLRTNELKVLVLDEADEMLDLGFREELEEILDTTPAERRTLLFSATLPRPIITLAGRYQRDALRLEVGGAGESHGDIEHRAIRIAPSDGEHAVVNLLRFYEAGAALVFCTTREAVRRLHANLVERGFEVVALSGELTQSERTHALQALRDRRARVCVATDVAARGIDIPDLELVIHADLPGDAETLQHRSGRTGRAGRKGISALLVPHPKLRRAEQLLRAARVQATWAAAPSAEDIRARDQERLVAVAAPVETPPSEEDEAAAQAMLAAHGAEAVARALVRLSRTRMPSPEDLIDVTPERPSAGAPYVPGAPQAPRPGFESTVWFRINVGRNKNAEARWLLPLICRRGHITKGEIGAIRVLERETRFQIVQAVADRFEEALRQSDEDGVRIERLDEALPLPPRDRRPVPRKAAEAEPWTPLAGRPPKSARPKPGGAGPRSGKGKPNAPRR